MLYLNLCPLLLGRISIEQTSIIELDLTQISYTATKEKGKIINKGGSQEQRTAEFFAKIRSKYVWKEG